jgi:4-hydroxy-3-polyprenylbenzoate decarboxylase
MQHRSTRDAVDDLKRGGRLIECDEPLSPRLEIPEIQRRVYARGGPAVLFTHPLGSPFPLLGNLFGSLDQARYLFRHTLERVKSAIQLKTRPESLIRHPWRLASAPWVAWTMLPKHVRHGPVQAHSIRLSQLPQLVSWPDDGGPFITLPQVLSQSAFASAGARAPRIRPPGLGQCNLGMYRIQLAGNRYEANGEVGLHYQIHRGIGVHHQEAIQAGCSFPVNVFVGGTPAMTLAAVMPLPEGLSELTFAGALSGHRIPVICSPDRAPIYAEADFCITGYVVPGLLKPEGPFGDHLGYYSLQHDYPVLRVTGVYHRPHAIWPFTVVGRPPQEDTTFGQLIHELTGPIIPTVLPGVESVHAVDAAGVHPLLLAVGSERYTPYRKPDRPQELLTQANAILGQGQLSLAKYLWIVNRQDAPDLDIDDISAFFQHALERVRWADDLHFQTRTTIDTLDYTGTGVHQGSKVVIAASGPKRRELIRQLNWECALPSPWKNPRLCIPGVVALEIGSESAGRSVAWMVEELSHRWARCHPAEGCMCLVLVDDAEFTAASLNNFLWVTFTRSNPATDIHGIEAFIEDKHWGCRGPLVIDARRKPHHAPPLVEDPQVTAKVDAMATRSGPLSKYL